MGLIYNEEDDYVYNTEGERQWKAISQTKELFEEFEVLAMSPSEVEGKAKAFYQFILDHFKYHLYQDMRKYKDGNGYFWLLDKPIKQIHFELKEDRIHYHLAYPRGKQPNQPTKGSFPYEEYDVISSIMSWFRT